MKYAIGLLIAVLQVLASASLADGAPVKIADMPPAATFMRIYSQTMAPAGFTDFCFRNSAACRRPSFHPGRPALDQRRWLELAEVNAVVNHTVAPRSDIELYGMSEYWTLPARFGDCEDYSLLKQAMLIERGWAPGSLLMTVVRDEAGQGHAVLTVSTKSGDYILDNRQDKIVAWQNSPYEFVKRQSTADPRVWLALERVDRQAPPTIASQSLSSGILTVQR